MKALLGLLFIVGVSFAIYMMIYLALIYVFHLYALLATLIPAGSVGLLTYSWGGIQIMKSRTK